MKVIGKCWKNNQHYDIFSMDNEIYVTRLVIYGDISDKILLNIFKPDLIVYYKYN